MGAALLPPSEPTGPTPHIGRDVRVQGEPRMGTRTQEQEQEQVGPCDWLAVQTEAGLCPLWARLSRALQLPWEQMLAWYGGAAPMVPA